MATPKILIVDDSYDKIQGIIKSLNDTGFDFLCATSSRCAVKLLKNTQFDLLVIDLQIPEDLGEEINQNGGVNLLDFISNNENLNKPSHIIGFTSHMDSYDESRSKFELSGWSIYFFDGDYSSISSVIKSQISYFHNDFDEIDVAIITALDHVELEAVLKFATKHSKIELLNDCSSYYFFELNSEDGKSLKVIATSCHGMGMAHAASMTMKVCIKFNPTYIIMTGIAAGLKDKVSLGDILIADACWDWGNGKQTINEGIPTFFAAPKQETFDKKIIQNLRTHARERTYLEKIYSDWPSSNRPSTALRVHVGPIATGSVVLENPDIVKAIKTQNRETIGIEMEAYGVCLAASLSSATPPKVLIIKSVCDFADPEKDDTYQGYAAFTSTSYAFNVIKNDLIF